MDFAQALYDKLAGDATLVGLLATYPAGSPQSPAVFTSWPVPADATRPYVFSAGNVADVPFDELAPNAGADRNWFGRDVIRDVFAIADNTGSDAAVETIAERIRAILHRASLSLPAGRHVMTHCVAGPLPAETDDSLIGRRLSFRIVAMEA